MEDDRLDPEDVENADTQFMKEVLISEGKIDERALRIGKRIKDKKIAEELEKKRKQSPFYTIPKWFEDRFHGWAIAIFLTISGSIASALTAWYQGLFN